MNMENEIKKWLEENETIPFIKLSQEEDFINFLLSLLPSINREKAIADTHKCAIAIFDRDYKSFSGCLAERLNNPQADT